MPSEVNSANDVGFLEEVPYVGVERLLLGDCADPLVQVTLLSVSYWPHLLCSRVDN